MRKFNVKMWIAATMICGAVVNFSSCENEEMKSQIEEILKNDSISKADLAKLQSLLSQAQKKVAETEQELQNVKQNQGGGSSKVDLSEIESEISGINSQIKNWKQLLQEKIDSLGEEIPSLEGLAKTEDIPSIEGLASKDDLQNFVSKEDIQGLPTADEIADIQEKVNQLMLPIYANGHEYVDLGLSVLWATCNIGAETPEKTGTYFAWGESEEYNKQKYTASDWQQDLDADHDAATQNWGGKWRMPSNDELEELLNKEKIHSEWVDDYNGKKGRVSYKKKEGEATYDVNSDVHIFLPAVGYYSPDELNPNTLYYNVEGRYWSHSYDDNNDKASILFFSSKQPEGLNTSHKRTNGLTIRPVLDKK